MRLEHKETGAIGKFYDIDGEYPIVIEAELDGETCYYTYETLAEVCKEWKDFKPVLTDNERATLKGLLGIVKNGENIESVYVTAFYDGTDKVQFIWADHVKTIITGLKDGAFAGLDRDRSYTLKELGLE